MYHFVYTTYVGVAVYFIFWVIICITQTNPPNTTLYLGHNSFATKMARKYLSNIDIANNHSVEVDSLMVPFHKISFISIIADVVRTYGKALCRCLLKKFIQYR
jgi:hypothetical protein